jgi:Domain of unknown function (DUF4168)
MDRILKSFKLILSTLLLLVLWIIPAQAVEAPVEPVEKIEQPARSELDTNSISSEKISQFVQSYLQVVALINQREGELQGAETESDSFRIKQEIETEAKSLIETAGLNFQEYIQLLTLANIDTEFSERIAAQLQEAMD